MMIARRADTRARADFATWKMMAKLNGASALPPEAQHFLASYKALLARMPEAEATETTINLMYKAYFGREGRHWTAARCPVASEPARGRQRHDLPPASGQAETVTIRAECRRKTAAAGGADLCLSRRGLWRDPLLLAVDDAFSLPR